MQPASSYSYQSFPDITLLITHYNRSGSLERLLESMNRLNLHFGEIVVSDDGSKQPHSGKLAALQAQYAFRLITAPVNKGLGNNLNKGQDAVLTPYTLYIQEDFVPTPVFADVLPMAMEMLKSDPGLDLARFYAYFRYPYLKPAGNGFGTMYFRFFLPGYKKFYMYSDHPHLRRSDFLRKFGRYREGVKGDVTEYEMMISFLKNKGRGIFYENFTGLLDQHNDSEEPSTMKRNFWRESDHLIIVFFRHIYRHFKMNWDYLF